MKRVLHIGLAVVLCIALTIPVFALEGVWHNPYGINDLYEAQPTERYPRDPAAGDVVYIKGTTWPVEFGQSVWISYTINGKSEQNIGAEWKYNDGNNSYWEAKMGPFAQGDVVEYVVHADKDGQNAQAVGPFSFNVTAWEQAKSVNLASESGGVITLDVTPDKGSFSPKLGLSFPSENILRFQFSPKGDTPFEPGRSNYTVTESGNRIVISTSALRVTITKSPYGIEVYDIKNGKTLTQNGGTGNELSWLTDGNDVIKSFREGFASPSNEQFYGFGERYNGIEKRGERETFIKNDTTRRT